MKSRVALLIGLAACGGSSSTATMGSGGGGSPSGGAYTPPWETLAPARFGGRGLDGSWTRDGDALLGRDGHYVWDHDRGDHVIEVDVELVDGSPDAAVGISTRMRNVGGDRWTGQESGYWFNWTFAGSFNVFVCEREAACYVLTDATDGWKPTSSIQGASVRVRVQQIGTEYRLFLNDELAYTGNHDLYTSGLLGLAASGGATFRFSDLRVYPELPGGEAPAGDGCAAVEAMIAAGEADRFDSIRGAEAPEGEPYAAVRTRHEVTGVPGATCHLMETIVNGARSVECAMGAGDEAEMQAAYTALVADLGSCALPATWVAADESSSFMGVSETVWEGDGRVRLRAVLRRDDALGGDGAYWLRVVIDVE